MLQLEECMKAKKKRDKEAGLVVRDITKIKQNVLKLPSKQNNSINIRILLWQHVSVLLDYLQASIQRHKIQSVHITYYGIPHYLQGVHKKYFKITKIIYIKSG
jgi:hypothetical protein